MSARTADLTAVNRRLRAEVKEREQAERTLRETQEALIQAARLKLLGQLATEVAHELTQPLAALRILAGNAGEFLRRGEVQTADRNLGIIGTLVDQMGGIIDRIKQAANKPPPFLQAVDCSHALGSALFLLDQRLRDEGVTVDNRCRPGAAIAWCDQNLLQEVLINLIVNAADAMHGQARRILTVDAVPTAGGRIAITVADTGPGLCDTTLARLFEPFFTTKPAGQGMGLGLSISQGIIQDLAGTLTAARGASGGALFTIDLPAAGAEKRP